MGRYARRRRGDRDGAIEETPRVPRAAASGSPRGRALSGGEQQMLAIGRALVGQPRLLMIDELSLGLAPLVVRRLLAA